MIVSLQLKGKGERRPATPDWQSGSCNCPTGRASWLQRSTGRLGWDGDSLSFFLFLFSSFSFLFLLGRDVEAAASYRVGVNVRGGPRLTEITDYIEHVF